MRNLFADELTRLGQQHPELVLLSGDIGNKLFDKFKAACPGRFYNCGIAEAGMMSMAAGLALCGLRPVVYTIAPFTTTRCFEQIRVDACYHKLPIIIAGTGAGLSYAELGPTHHSCEDLAILRTLPDMTLLAPCDPLELRELLSQALHLPGPCYLRLGKKGEPLLHPLPQADPPGLEPTPIRIGQAAALRHGRDLCLIGTGPLLGEVLQAAALLEQQGHSVHVESFHTVKPLDTQALSRIFQQFPFVAVIEEHSRIGGLAGGIAEWKVATQTGGRLLSLGVDDVFMHEVGSQQYARTRFGLTGPHIAARVQEALPPPITNSQT